MNIIKMNNKRGKIGMLLPAMILFFGLIANPALAADKWAAVSLDANTLGLGFLIEPALVNITEQPKASVVLTDFLRDNITTPDGSDPWKMTGSIDTDFYLSQIYCPSQENATVADYIVKVMPSEINYNDRFGEWLGEFKYSSMSGWMYSVNSKFPGVGAGDYTLNDGDVMRWQFTLYGYGADLNADNSAWGQPSIVNSGNKDGLTWHVAYLNGRFAKSVLEQSSAYTKAMAVLQDPVASGATVNAAFTELLSSIKLYNDTELESNSIAEINFMTARHLFNGTGNGDFEPSAAMTMPMFLTVMYRMSGSPETNNANSDYVALEAWARPAVAWAAGNGLVNEELAAKLTNDSSLSAASAVELANKLLVLSGGADGAISYSASGDLSRAQAAEILSATQNVLQQLK